MGYGINRAEVLLKERTDFLALCVDEQLDVRKLVYFFGYDLSVYRFLTVPAYRFPVVQEAVEVMGLTKDRLNRRKMGVRFNGCRDFSPWHNTRLYLFRFECTARLIALIRRESFPVKRRAERLAPLFNDPVEWARLFRFDFKRSDSAVLDRLEEVYNVKNG